MSDIVVTPAGAVNVIVTAVAATNVIINGALQNSASSFDDGAGGVIGKKISAKGASGTISMNADPDGGDFNIYTDHNGVLALYGQAGNTLNLNLLDGYLQLSALNAGQVPYLDSNRQFANSFLYVDSLNSRLGIGTNSPTTKLDINGGLRVVGKINNVTDPTSAQDAATKNYVDNQQIVINNAALALAVAL